jgi:hypothetical protein
VFASYVVLRGLYINALDTDCSAFSALYSLLMQLPPEKRIVETGVKFPVKTYRRKTASEMVKSFRKHNKPPHEVRIVVRAIGLLHFVIILASNYSGLSVCMYVCTCACVLAQSPRFTKAQFEALMLSSYVCAWAECYRGRN